MNSLANIIALLHVVLTSIAGRTALAEMITTAVLSACLLFGPQEASTHDK